MLNLGPIAGWVRQPGVAGSATCLLTRYGERTSRSGITYLRLELADASGAATGYVWPEARAAVTCGMTPIPVAVTGTLQQFQGHAQLRVMHLAAVDPEEVPSATALLPHAGCPDQARPALARLARLEAELPAPLAGFLRQVLLDPALGVPFLRCRASVAHHHSYQGGLLVHSTELLDQAAALAHQILPEDEWAPWLAQLGYLLHDLGKLRTVGAQRRPDLPFLVRHEQWTLALLAPHLAWLEARDRRLAAALRYIWACLATPAAHRPVPEYFIAELVATLDQWSAASHNHRDLAHLLQAGGTGPRGWPRRVPQPPASLPATAGAP